jgi:hypothetical protein
MKLEFVPLLRVQRDLYRMPLGLSGRAGFAPALRDASIKMSGK